MFGVHTLHVHTSLTPLTILSNEHEEKRPRAASTKASKRRNSSIGSNPVERVNAIAPYNS